MVRLWLEGFRRRRFSWLALAATSLAPKLIAYLFTLVRDNVVSDRLVAWWDGLGGPVVLKGLLSAMADHPVLSLVVATAVWVAYVALTLYRRGQTEVSPPAPPQTAPAVVQRAAQVVPTVADPFVSLLAGGSFAFRFEKTSSGLILRLKYGGIDAVTSLTLSVKNMRVLHDGKFVDVAPFHETGKFQSFEIYQSPSVIYPGDDELSIGFLSITDGQVIIDALKSPVPRTGTWYVLFRMQAMGSALHYGEFSLFFEYPKHKAPVPVPRRDLWS